MQYLTEYSFCNNPFAIVEIQIYMTTMQLKMVLMMELRNE